MINESAAADEAAASPPPPPPPPHPHDAVYLGELHLEPHRLDRRGACPAGWQQRVRNGRGARPARDEASRTWRRRAVRSSRGLAGLRGPRAAALLAGLQPRRLQAAGAATLAALGVNSDKRVGEQNQFSADW